MFSRKFDELYRHHVSRIDRRASWRFKTWWVENSVRKATQITVQTKALADAVAAEMRLLAGWLSLGEIRAEPSGDLGPALAAALG